MYINTHPTIFLHNINPIAYMPDSSLTKDIQFFESQVLGHIHIPLCNRH